MSTMIDVLSVVARAVSFVLLFQAVGVVFFLARFRRLLTRAGYGIRRLGWSAALAAVAAVICHQALEAGRMAGEMAGILDPSLQGMAMHSATGVTFVLQVVGLTMVAAGLYAGQDAGNGGPPNAGPADAESADVGLADARLAHARLADAGVAEADGDAPRAGEVRADAAHGDEVPAPRAHAAAPGLHVSAGSHRDATDLARDALARGRIGPWWSIGLSVTGTVVAIASFALVGHTVSSAHRWLLAPLLLMHLSIVAFWFGSLWPLYLVVRREPQARAARIIDAFSASAVWLVPLILVAGVGMAFLLLPDVAALRQPYGELLLTKVALFAILMGLAALNKWRLGPAISRGDPRAPSGFRRSVLAEYILICSVLAVTATMTSLFSPE